MSMPPIQKLLNKLYSMTSFRPIKTNNGWKAKCPAHDDTSPSLSLAVGDDGRVLLHCFAGCTAEKIVASLNMTMQDLMPDEHGNGRKKSSGPIKPKASPARWKGQQKSKTFATAKDAIAELERHHNKRSAMWIYHNAEGEPVGVIVRWDRSDGKKDILPVSRNCSGKWNVGGMPKPRPLYGLPELLTAEKESTVFVVEGEQCVEAARSIGLVATTSPHGSKSAEKADWTPLADRRVVLMPDNDNDGREYVATVASILWTLKPYPTIKIVPLPDLPVKGDIADFIIARRESGCDDDEIRRDIERIAQDVEEQVQVERPSLPQMQLPGGSRTINAAASELGQLLAAKQTHFCRGNSISRIAKDDEGETVLHPVKPAGMTSDFEEVARLFKIGRSNKQQPTTCREATAKLIMNSQVFLENLPMLRVLSRCPVLIEQDGELVEVTGYDPVSGVLSTASDGVATVSLDEAKVLLNELVDGFKFATPSDRSRALAALITPALISGGLLGGRPPIDLGESDHSQTGKGFRNKITAAVYRHTPRAVTQRRGGVGSLEESFDKALITGANFISLDNIRGRVDFPAIESFMTEDSYSARAPYTPVTEIDPRRVTVMFTSNQADMTRDLANRLSCVRILKQPDGYSFAKYPEGDILDHLRANQPKYLGAIFAIIRAWYAQGKPRTTETRHDFRVWAQTLDWIVQNILGEAPLMDGHRETQARMTNTNLNWLRSVVLAAVQQNRIDTWLTVTELLEIIVTDGCVEIPGLKDDAKLDLEEEPCRKAILQHIGRKLKRCFGTKEVIDFDGRVIERGSWTDDKRRRRFHYRIDLDSSQNTLASKNSPKDQFGRAQTARNAFSPDPPLDKSLVSPDSPDRYIERERIGTVVPSALNIFSMGMSGDQGGSGGNCDVVVVPEADSDGWEEVP
ncbi:MAG: hypothetical protein JXM70_00760 [Pirellulales bacterium]|nr:hypothetical protein [Pirellulales bacterium]